MRFRNFASLWEKKENDSTRITPRELKSKLDRNEKITLIDVRERDEWEICHIEGSKLIPLGELSNRLEELDRDGLTILYCHHGMRSAHALLLLKQRGFKNLRSLQGGIAAWSDQVDPHMKRY